MKIDTTAASTNGTAAAAPPAINPKLVNAAHQFESIMLQQMLKPMMSHEDSWGGDDGESHDNSLDTLSSYGTEAVATAISKDGGLGIARQVIQQVTQEHLRETQKEPHGTKVYREAADKFK
jgi:flagellar protein FlgJ